jgi:hypothetical protein
MWRYSIRFLSKLWRKWQFSAIKSQNPVTQGADGTAVEETLFVLRCVEPPHDYQIGGLVLPAQMVQIESGFQLSSADEKSTPPHLSVWVEPLTTVEQAYRFLPENSKRKTLALRIQISCIKQIFATESGLDYPHLLDVVWVHIESSEPGAEGHAGITGLDDASIKLSLKSRGYPILTKRQVKNIRKDLRAQLAELASQDAQLVRDM